LRNGIFTEKNMSDKVSPSAATADDFDNAQDIVLKVPAPELGPGKFVWALCPNVEQLESLNAADFAQGSTKRGPRFLVRWAQACVVNNDVEKKRILGKAKAESLAKKSATLLERIYYSVQNGPKITEAAIEAEAGNSDADPSPAS
jgi:hypothetical protein